MTSVQTILTATVPALAGASYSAATGGGYIVGPFDSSGAFQVVVQASPHYLLTIYPSAGSGIATFSVGIDTSAGGLLDISSKITSVLGGPGTFSALGITTKTSAYPITSADYTVLGDATTASFTVTLPAAPALGEIHNVKLIATASAHTLTIAGNGKLIDGSANAIISVVNTSLQFQYDGAAWRVI